MTLFSTTLRPGLLVGLKTKIEGNVETTKIDIIPDHVTADGERIAKWQTERTVLDAAEHEEALKVRNQARAFITGLCARSDFGLLCPESKKGDLEEAISKARRVVAEFNVTARLTEITFGAVTGRIAADDVEAVRAINGEVRSLLKEMEDGISRLDVKAVRDAADKARKLGSMLTPEAQARVQEALSAARGVATKMVAAGDQAASAVDEEVLAKLAAARTAFLDLDPQGEVAQPEAQGRGLDLDPEVEVAEVAAAPVVDIDLDDMLS